MCFHLSQELKHLLEDYPTEPTNEAKADKYLRAVSKLITNDDLLIDIGIGLEFDAGEIEAIRTDNADSIVRAGYKLLLEWRRNKIKTIDCDILKCKLSPVLKEIKLGGKFMKIEF